MPRPSQAQDQALLQAGLALYPPLGCAGLTVRRLADEAGVNPAMVGYHFGNKDGFLRALLQRFYEDFLSGLSLEAERGTDARERLRSGLLALARFAREHRPLVARIWADAQAGVPLVQDFMRDNAPRHLGLLMRLLLQAQAEGTLRATPPLQAFALLMGSVVAPVLFAGGVVALGVAPPLLAQRVDADVLDDAALAWRVDTVLAGLRPGPAGTGGQDDET